jgi:acetyl esterase/lipase
MIRIINVIYFLFLVINSFSQEVVEIPIWADKPPNSNHIKGKEVLIDSNRIAKVTVPTIRVFIPKHNSGVAVLDCPGGGYSYVQVAKDGEFYFNSKWFNNQGLVYIYLKYRLPNQHADVPFSDAEQAMRVIKAHAEEWGINPNKIGVMGTSAGGHLASTLAVRSHNDTRPYFQILVVPVISMVEDYKHKGSCNQLLGRQPTKEAMRYYSNNLHVSSKTPQAFIVANNDDTTVPSLNAINYGAALRKNNVPTEIHLFPKGGHAGLFYNTYPYKNEALGLLKKWLNTYVK